MASDLPVKQWHEFRDPIHGFVRVDSDERKVIDSRPFQRLRHIHQLALTYLVYPSASHKRFEHSLGVMELASRVFEAVLAKLDDPVAKLVPKLTDEKKQGYWRSVLRLAALLHDVGHLPFSHAAEKQLLPEDYDHERIGWDLITTDPDLKKAFEGSEPPVRSEDVARIAVGKVEGQRELEPHEKLLNSIITGDAFGVDRIDYLLRDAHHCGVAYGRFDHYRLIDTLMILIDKKTGEPALGVEYGGLQAAESLNLARYLMYSQVYLHPVRRAYDKHLQSFLSAWLDEGKFKTDSTSFLAITDNEVLTAIHKAVYDAEAKGHPAAERIWCRKHFKILYQPGPEDDPEIMKTLVDEAGEKFPDDVFYDNYQKDSSVNFPVLKRTKEVGESLQESHVLRNLPPIGVNALMVNPSPDVQKKINEWLSPRLAELTTATPKEKPDDKKT